MPLESDAVYTIRNDLTHTVLDFTGNTARNVFAMCWGWHGGGNQKWKIIQVGAANLNTWKLQNLRDNPGRFLCPQVEDGQPDEQYRLSGGVVACDFVISKVEPTEKTEQTEQYRILFNNIWAVILVTGQEVHNIHDLDRVLDLHADGPPLALQPVQYQNCAQIWSFLRDLPVDPALTDGAYAIVNSQTGTVLGVPNGVVGNPVLGLVSKGEDKWTVTRNLQGRYTLKSSTGHFLAPEVDPPQNGTPLVGGPKSQAKLFTIRKVPGTQFYKIFMTEHTILSGLAVNLAVVDGEPDSLDGAVVSLQADEAQTWLFCG